MPTEPCTDCNSCNCSSVPFIHSTVAEGDATPVNFADMFTFEKYSRITTTSSKSPAHSIIFYRDENSVGPKEIYWNYINKADRDTEYDKVLALVSKPIV